MSSSDDHFDEFKDHTRLKHGILTAYLQAWATKLLANSAPSTRVQFVDAFAGQGRDKAGNDGSPLIALSVAKSVLGLAAAGKLRPSARMRYVGIESRPGYLRLLRTYAAPDLAMLGEHAEILSGTLVDHLPYVLNGIGNQPMLTFLDPFGIMGLDASTYPSLLHGPKNEVFALFAHLGAVRLHGVLQKDANDYYEHFNELQASPLLFADIQESEERASLAQADASAEQLDVTATASREILQKALGDVDWNEQMRDVPREGRADKFVEMFANVLLSAGASIVQVIPMHDSEGRPKYVLVHASKSIHAFCAMKEAVSSSLNKSELSQTMRLRIRDDLSVDLEAVVDWLCEASNGKTVPWATNPTANANAKDGTVKRAVLARTAMFPFQIPDLKSKLTELGWLSRVKQREYITFPAKI